MKRIKCNLSAKSFLEAAQQVRAYRESLEEKCSQFVHEVAEAGYQVTRAVLQQNVDTGLTIGSMEIVDESANGNFRVKVVVSSDAILFLEFGSGLIGEGTAIHAGQFGMGSGTYPSEKGHWADPSGWWYYDEAGKRRHSRGMIATMPMYQGGKEMEMRWREIANKVFKW